MKQELLEVADQGLHWQSNMKAGGYEGGEDLKESSAKAFDIQATEGGVAKNLKTDAMLNSKETNGLEELEDNNAKVKDSCEEIDVFLDAELEQDQGKLEQRLPDDRFLKFQPQQERDDDEKFFIVQPLDDKETDQDRVIAFVKNQDENRDGDSSDYEDITDVFRDIEIEDLEAEKENVGGNNIADVEKVFSRDNSSPLLSKIHYKNPQDTSKLDSCLVETFEEIII